LNRKLKLFYKGFIFFVFVQSLVFATSFKKLGVINEERIHSLFRDRTSLRLSHINSVKLDKAIRPLSWPDRIPFATFINNDGETRAGVVEYPSFFKKRIRYIENDEIKNPVDIFCNSKGFIGISCDESDRVFLYNYFPKESKFSIKGVVSVKNPSVIYINKSSETFVVSDSNIIQIFNSSGIPVKKVLATNINKLLKDQKVKDICINRYNELFVLTDKVVVRISSRGSQLGVLELKKDYVSIATSIYGDIFLLDSENKAIDKYSRRFYFLDDLDLSHWKVDVVDICVLPNYGYLAVTGADYGEYYGLGVRFKDESFKSIGPNLYHVTFVSTFPSTVKIIVSGVNQFSVNTILEEQFFLAGKHTVLWDGKDSEGEAMVGMHSISIEGKAKYSLGNSEASHISQIELKN
jgi:hypothetical protein